MKKRFSIKVLNRKVKPFLLLSILLEVGCVYGIDNALAIFTGFSLIPWSQYFVVGSGFGKDFSGKKDRKKRIQRCINRSRLSPDVIDKIKLARSDTVPPSSCEDVSLEEYNNYICSQYDVKKEDYPSWYRDMEKRYKSKRKSQRQNCQQKIMAKNERIKLLKRNLSEQKEKIKNTETRYNESFEKKGKDIQHLKGLLKKANSIDEGCISKTREVEEKHKKLKQIVLP